MTTKVSQRLIIFFFIIVCTFMQQYINVLSECFDFFHSAIYTPTVLALFPQHTFQITPHAVSLTRKEAYAVEA